MAMTIQDLFTALQGQSGQFGQGGGGGNSIPLSSVPAPTPLSGQPMSDQGQGLAGAPSGDMSGMGAGMSRSPVQQMGSGMDMSQADISQLLNQIAASQPGAFGSLTAGLGGGSGGGLGQYGSGGSVGQGYGGQYGAGGVIGQQDPRLPSPVAQGSGSDLKSILGGLGGALSLGQTGVGLYNLLQGPTSAQGGQTASPTTADSVIPTQDATGGMGGGMSSNTALGATPWGGSASGLSGGATPWGGQAPAGASSTPQVSGLETMTGAQGGTTPPAPFDYGFGQGGQGGLPAGGTGQGFMGTMGDLGRSIGNFGVGPVNVGNIAPYAGGLINLGTGLATGNENQIGAGVTGLGTAGATSLFPSVAQTAANATAEGLGGAGAASGLASMGAGLTSAGAMAAAQFLIDVISGQSRDGSHGVGQGQRWGQAALNVIPGLNAILGAFGIDPYAPSKAWQTFPARAAQDWGHRNQELGDFARQLYGAQSPEAMRAAIQQYNKAMGGIPGGPLNKGQYGIMQMPDFDPFETHGYFLPGTQYGSYLPDVSYEKGTQLGYTPNQAAQQFFAGQGVNAQGPQGRDPISQAYTDYNISGMPLQGGMWGASPLQQFMQQMGSKASFVPGSGGGGMGPSQMLRIMNDPNIAQQAGSMNLNQIGNLNPTYAAAHKVGRYGQAYGNIDQLIAQRMQGLNLPDNFWTS